MGVKRHRWTSEDDNYLRLYFDGTQESVRKLAAHMGLGFYAVDTRTSRLGIKNRGRFQPWSATDKERLAELVGQVPLEIIAERLGRSIYSVKGAVSRFGFRSGYREGWYTATEVAGILGVHNGWVSRRIKDGSLEAKKHGVGPERPERGPRQWHIEERTLRRFILEHAGELVGRNVDLWALVNIVSQGKMATGLYTSASRSRL